MKTINKNNLTNNIKKWISWWLPVLLLILFYSPSLFNDKVRIETVYPLSVYQQDSVDIQSYNQDIIKVNYPYHIYKNWAVYNQKNLDYNPYQFSGQPLWGEAIFGLFSFRSIVSYIFNPDFAFTFIMFLHGILLVVFGNLILKNFEIGSVYKTLSIIILSFSSESLFQQQNSYSEFTVWLFAEIWLFVYLWKNQNRIDKLWIKISTIGAFIWAWTMYINHPLYEAQHLIILMVFAVIASKYKVDGQIRKLNKKIIFAFVLIVIFSVGLSAWQWLPTYEALGYSYRAVTSKDTFMPIFIRIMPFAMPYDTISYVLRDGFNFMHYDGLIHLAKFDGNYISITLFFLISCVFFEPSIRKQTKILWLPYLIIFFGYNFLAIITIIPFINNFLVNFGLLKSVHLANVVAFSNIFLYLLTGFGLFAFVKLCEQGKVKKLLISWSLIIILYILANFVFAYVFRMFLDSRYGVKGLEYYSQFPISPEVLAAVKEAVVGLISRWNPIPSTFMIAIAVVIIEFILLLFVYKNKFRNVALFGFIATSVFVGYNIQSERFFWTDANKIIPKVKVIDYIKSQNSVGRITAVRKTENINDFLMNKSYKNHDPVKISMNNYIESSELPFMPAMSLLYMVEDIRGVSSLNNRDYRIFLEGVKALKETSEFQTPKMFSEIIEKQTVHQRSWDLLNTKWILSKDELDYSGYNLILKDNLNLYENKNAKPRIWFSTKYRVFPDRKKLLLEMTKPEWKLDEILLEIKPQTPKNSDYTSYGYVPQEYLMLENNNFEWEEHKGLISKLWLPKINSTESDFIIDDSATAVIKWIDKRAGYNRVKVNVTGKGLLFFSEVFYPGWKLKVDGEFRDIYRADYALMAAPIEKGEHIVELYFESDSANAGFKISCITGIIFVILIIIVIINKAARRK